MPEDEELLTVEEVAKQLRVNPETVRVWIRNRELAALDLGRGYRISREDLEEFKRQRRTDRKK